MRKTKPLLILRAIIDSSQLNLLNDFKKFEFNFSKERGFACLRFEVEESLNIDFWSNLSGILADNMDQYEKDVKIKFSIKSQLNACSIKIKSL